MIFATYLYRNGKMQLLEDAGRQTHRDSHMSISEMMTVVIGFHMSHHSDFKNYYLGYVSCFYKSDFPKLHTIFGSVT
jgi:hypothetical protein